MSGEALETYADASALADEPLDETIDLGFSSSRGTKATGNEIQSPIFIGRLEGASGLLIPWLCSLP